MAFDRADDLDRTPVRITHDSITWGWMEGTHVSDMEAVKYIGYKLRYSEDTIDWLTGPGVPFQPHTSHVQWQMGTINGLQPETEYYFYVVVYRVYFGGQIYQSPYTSKQEFGLLSATTTKGNFIQKISYNM